MAETHVISALRAKRAEVSGYIHDLEKKAKTWRARLAHIDATIKIFSPETDPDAIPPRRTYRRSGYFKKGELARLCLDELRKAEGQPITTAAIVAGVIKAKGLPDDPALAWQPNRTGFDVSGVLSGRPGRLPRLARAETPDRRSLKSMQRVLAPSTKSIATKRAAT